MAGSGGQARGRRWLWVGVAVAACGVVGAVVAVWLVPPKLYPADAPEARAALQSGLLTAAAAMVAVAGGLVALAETQKANAEVRRANERTHVRELYATAIGQLGSDTLDVRLGGIYALEQIAVDSETHHRTVVEVLSAFVREHSTPGTLRRQRDRPAPPEPADGEVPPAPASPDTDVQAALTVLGRLPTRSGVPRGDLTGAHLTGAELAGANLTDASLGKANLTGAHLFGANLTGARLSRANLSSARLDGANLTRAALVEADLTGAWLHGAKLAGAFLRGADLAGARLFDAKLAGAWLVRVDLSGAVGLTRTQLEAADGNAMTKLPDERLRPAHWPKLDDPEDAGHPPDTPS